MTFTVTKLPDEPIVIYTQGAELDSSQSIGETLDAIAALLDQQSTPVYLIFNVDGTKISLDDLIQATSKGARSTNAVLHHSMVIESMTVNSSTLVRMATKGLESATFGQVKVLMFATLDEALNYCRGQLKTDF